MRFKDLPMEYKRIAVEFIGILKNQDEHAYCFSKRSHRRRGAYSSWEQHRNCDVEIWAQDGRCKHGTYVGGCGIDWMCQYCENGMTDYEWAIGRAWNAYNQDQRKKAIKEYESIIAFFNEIKYQENVPAHVALLDRACKLAIQHR